MGICYQTDRKKGGIDNKSLPKEAPIMTKEELGMGHRQITLKIANKLSNSICKITFKIMKIKMFMELDFL